MPRQPKRLSALRVTNLALRGWYCDGYGLWLQVKPSGAKSWVFRYAVRGQRRHMGLGSLRHVSLAEARAKALELGTRIASGEDPLLERRSASMSLRVAQARQMTFDACAEAYIRAHQASWKNAKHAKQWAATLATYASPVFGALPVVEVDTPLILKALEPIWAEKTETAKRLRGRIECILDWATVSKYRAGENPARWRGHLDYLLANPNKIAPVENHAALPWRNAPGFMAELALAEGVGARALEFAILTAARSGEVRGATWAELDLDEALWIVPAERMKAGREHRVPLADELVKRLTRLRLEHQPSPPDVVFPGQKGKVLSDMSLTAVLRRMGRRNITVHGFRSTFRDWCAEYPPNAFPREVCEHALAHQLPDRVEAAYRRGDLLDRRRQLMAKWAEYLHGRSV